MSSCLTAVRFVGRQSTVADGCSGRELLTFGSQEAEKAREEGRGCSAVRPCVLFLSFPGNERNPQINDLINELTHLLK